MKKFSGERCRAVRDENKSIPRVSRGMFFYYRYAMQHANGLMFAQDLPTKIQHCLCVEKFCHC